MDEAITDLGFENIKFKEAPTSTDTYDLSRELIVFKEEQGI